MFPCLLEVCGERSRVQAQRASSIKSFHWGLCGPLRKGTRTAFELKVVTSLFSAKNLDRNK